MKRLILLKIIASTIAVVCFNTARGQLAVKTNLIYDALLNANIGVETGVAPHWSIDVSGNYNGWKITATRQWKHWFVQPEVRYWLGDKMKGHFLAANVIGGQFNARFGGDRRQGWGAGVGAGYGYTWRFGRHWGLEAEITAGYLRYHYDKYPCATCGRKIATRNRNYVGPTKAALNVVYYFGAPEAAEPIVEVPLPVVEEPIAVIVADTLPQFDFPLVDVPHSRVLTENISGVARVRFAVSKTDIDPSLGDNSNELDAITAKLDSMRNGLGMQIVSVKFTGYASPEGSYANNDRLAAGRTAALRQYIQTARHLPDSVVSERHVAEDWDGLRAAVAASSLPDKEDLLTIIDSGMKPDAKEGALKRYKASWTRIAADMLPALRRTEYRIECEHRYEEQETRTLEEVNRAIREGDPQEAARLLVDIPSSPEADYARGVVAALQHRYDEAAAWFARAESRGISVAADALDQLNTKTDRQTQTKH